MDHKTSDASCQRIASDLRLGQGVRIYDFVNLYGFSIGDRTRHHVETIVKRDASIGSGGVILCNVYIGENVLVGAGSVVTKDVPANAIVDGASPRLIRYLERPAATLG
jgi:acetyltransferase-like isoleucine patch superfamily enzyme